MAREIRFDRNRLAKAKRTAQGFARVDARLTRTGILEYTRPDGSVQREYRPEDEVFREDSLASLDGVPVTDLHPPCMVDATNRKQYSIGTVRSPRRDGVFPSAELQIEDADVIAKIDAGDRVEISCGYSCDLDMTPGEFEGQRYDAIQRNIIYNHAAIGPRHWGRAGADVAMRLDCGDAPAGALVARFDVDQPVGDTRDNPTKITRDSGETRKMSLKINGVEIKLDERDEALISAELKKQTERADAAEAKVQALQTEAGATAVKLQAVTARADSAEARVAKIDRAQLEADARVALGSEAKFDGKSDAQIRAEVVGKMLPQVRVDSKDDAFVAGAFAAAMDIARKAQADLTAAGAGAGAAGSRTDASDARAEMIARNQKMAG